MTTTDAPVTVEQLKPCPFCGGKAERYTIGDDEPNNAGGDVIVCTSCQASSHVEFGFKENLVSIWNSRHRLAALASAPAEPLPDIGPDPFKRPRDDDRYEASRLRLRAAYVQQQKGVPDQTALVWRYDLGTVLEMAIRLKSILADDEEPASVPAEQTWRCFHCGDVFTNERCARLHFGRNEDSDPACIIKAGAEQGLLSALREAEYAAADARQAIADESTDAAKAYYAQATRHAAALRNAEEAGYERGLADGRSLASAPAGDGVEKAVLEAVALIDEINARPSSRDFYGIGPGTTGKLATVRATLAAALARPRAAVEEREALNDLCEAMEYWSGCDDGVTPDEAESHIASAGGYWPALAYKKARAILALQSPPAKVEGQA